MQERVTSWNLCVLVRFQLPRQSRDSSNSQSNRMAKAKLLVRSFPEYALVTQWQSSSLLRNKLEVQVLSSAPFPFRLMVGRKSLELAMLVRVQRGEPTLISSTVERFSHKEDTQVRLLHKRPRTFTESSPNLVWQRFAKPSSLKTHTGSTPVLSAIKLALTGVVISKNIA